MKKLLVLVLLLTAFAAPTLVQADHLDVIYVNLKADCSFPDYMAIIGDFNAWAADYGYKTEIAMPIQSETAGTLIWIGRSKNAEAFGKAWDAWRDGQMDSESTPTKLQMRFNQCSEPLEVRRGYDTY